MLFSLAPNAWLPWFKRHWRQSLVICPRYCFRGVRYQLVPSIVRLNFLWNTWEKGHLSIFTELECNYTQLSLNGHLHKTSQKSGNKKHHSTKTLNILVTYALLEAIGMKKLTALMQLDLLKAFDSICHPILPHKLSCVGASPATVKWFSSYRSCRSQAVRIGSVTSSPRPITHRVPQGATLSPLLFCIYTSDLPSAPQKCHLESFVDDSKVY